MTVSFWQQGWRPPTRSYDVAVVGGGIVGCSTAYWLHRMQPSLRVAIVEARTLAHGASGRNAGFILQGTDTDFRQAEERYGRRAARRIWHFTQENRDLIAAELNGRAFGWTPCGSVTAAGTEEENEGLRFSVPRLRSAGAPVVYLTAQETNERLQSDQFLGSLYCTSGGVVDPYRLVRHIAAESEADVLDHHSVERIAWENGRAILDTPPARIEAGQVVLALNAYAPRLVPSLGAYVRPVRAQMCATEAMPEVHLSVPVYSHEGYYYVRQSTQGHLLVGGARHLHRATEVGYDDRTTPAVQATLERYLHTHFPWTRALAVERRWSGTMGFSPDGLPVAGPLPDAPGHFFATGFTGHGMGYGFHFGRLMADLVTGQPRPHGYDLFAAARFDTEASGEDANISVPHRSSPEV